MSGSAYLWVNGTVGGLVQEAQHRPPAIPQAQREVVPPAALLADPPLRPRDRQRRLDLVKGQRLRNHLGVAPLDPLQARLSQFALQLAGQAHDHVRLPRQLLHPARPSFPVEVHQGLQLP